MGDLVQHHVIIRVCYCRDVNALWYDPETAESAEPTKVKERKPKEKEQKEEQEKMPEVSKETFFKVQFSCYVISL